MSLKHLDDFGGSGFAPQTGNQFPALENLADGNYDFTILTASIGETKNTGQDIIRLECRCEQTAQVVEKVYFPSSQENINRFAGDMGTLGFEVGTWGAKVPLSKAIPETVEKLKGVRFKGTKKTTPPNKDGKRFHNLYVNARLPDGDGNGVAEAAAAVDPSDVPF